MTRKRKWLRRFVWGVSILLFLGLVLRVVLWLSLPWILDSTVQGFGLHADYERLDLSIATGDMELWHLALTHEGSDEALVDMEYCRVDVAMAASLFSWKLVARRVEVDGMDVRIHRAADGTFPDLQEILAGLESKEEEEPEEEEARGDLVLASPLVLDALRLQHVQLHLVDETFEPALERRFDFNLRLSNFGSEKHRTRFGITISSPPIIDQVRFEWTAWVRDETLEMDFEAKVRGYRPERIVPYLALVGLKPVGRNYNFGFKGKIRTASAEDGHEAWFDLDDLVLEVDGEETLALDRLSITADAVDLDSAHVSLVEMEGGRALARRLPSGDLCVAGMKLVPIAHEPVEPEKKRGHPFDVSVDRVLLSNFKASFIDESITPSNALALALVELSIDDIRKGQPLTLRGRFRADGLANTVELNGTADLFAAEKRVDLQLAVDGIAPRALEPYLRQAGLESRLSDGDFSCNLSAALGEGGAMDLAVTKIRYADGEDLFLLEKLEVSKARFDAASNVLKIDSIDVEGQMINVQREASGSLAALGFALTGKPAASSPGVAKASPPPRVEIARLSWRDNRIHFVDQAAGSLSLEGLTMEASDLVVDLAVGAAPAPPGKVEMRMAIPGLAEQITLSGTLQLWPEGLAAELELDGTGLNGTAAAPFLEAVGLSPRFVDASLHLGLRSSVAMTGTGLNVDLELEKVALRESGEELAGLDRMKISGFAMSAEKIHVAAVEIIGPRIKAGRDGEGVFHAAGVGILMQPKSTEVETHPGRAPVIELGWLGIENAILSWNDRAATPPVEVSFVSNVSLENLGFRDGPADFSVSLTVPETGKTITAKGNLYISPNAQRVNLEVDAQGLSAGPLAAYLPPGMRCTLEEGRFHAKLEAEAGKHPEGGLHASLAVTDVTYVDGTPLLKLDAARATVTRLDLDSGVVAMGELSVAGLETAVEKTEGGAMRLLGIEIRPVTAPEEPEEDVTPPPVEKRPAPRKLPLVTLDKLDLNLRKLTVLDRTQPGPQAPLLSDVRLLSKRPIELLGDQPESRPPVELALQGSIDPLVDSFHVGIQASPFASPALLKVAFDVKGISGEGVTRIYPALSETIDGTHLTDGRLSGAMELALNATRRGALDFKAMKKFGLDLVVKAMAFRNGENGEVLAGLEELLVDVDEVDMESGDIHIRTVELIKPRALVSKEEDGLHVLDLVVNLPEPQPQVETKAEAPMEEGPDIRVDRIWISGIDFTIRDRTSEPNMIVPLTDLDFEVEGFTTRAVTEPKPIRFNMLVSAGSVPIPISDEERPLFEEIMASGKIVLYPKLEGWLKTGVSALEVTGFRGPARASGVELNEGVFDAGVDVRFQENGRMSTSARFLFTDLSLSEPDDGPITRFLKLPASLDTVLFVLRDEDGAIEIPLDFEMSEEGLGAAQITTMAVTTLSLLIADAVMNTPFRVVGTVSSLGSLVLGGDDEEEEKTAGDPVVLAFEPGTVVPASASRKELKLLAGRMEDEDDLVLTLRHELGGGDLEEAYLRANPSPEDCHYLIIRLKARRIELLSDRAEVASRARAAYASGFESECSAQTQRLQEIDRELGLVEQSLDRVLELMRPGAERQAIRRARDACIAIGSARLKAVLEAMKEAGVEDADERIRITRPRYHETGGSGGGVVTLTPGRRKVL